MDHAPDEEEGSSIHFIAFEPNSKEKRSRNTHLARAHVARVNRRKQAARQVSNISSGSRTLSPVAPSATVTKEQVRDNAQIPITGDFNEEDVKESPDDKAAWPTIKRGYVEEDPETSELLIERGPTGMVSSTMVSSPRTLAPVFGALPANSFDSASSLEAAGVVQYGQMKSAYQCVDTA